jgi:putative spermidine/putrescine transport system permease protein
VITSFILCTTIASLSQLDLAQLDTSASLGAGPLYAFRRVTLPVIRPGILAGTFRAFMAAVDDVSVSLFLANPDTDVLPIRMWSMLESTLDVRTAAVSGVMIVTTALFVFVLDRGGGPDAPPHLNGGRRSLIPGPPALPVGSERSPTQCRAPILET